MKSRAWGWWPVVLLGLLAEPAARAPGAAAGKALGPAGEASRASGSSAQRHEEPALLAYRDPANGKFVQGAPEVAARSAAADGLALGAWAEGLIEEPTATPAGGAGVRLSGRYRSYLVARREAGGDLRLECLQQSPQPTEEPRAAESAGASGERWP